MSVCLCCTLGLPLAIPALRTPYFGSKHGSAALTVFELSLMPASQLNLIPYLWKLPKYRHASYADEFMRPDSRNAAGDEDFAEYENNIKII